MKGPRLHIYILISAAILGIVTMVSLNLYPSWSQYARSSEEQLLLVTLSCISAIFFIRAFHFPRWQKTLFMWPVRANVRQVNLWTGYMFLGIICTPVTIGVWWVEILHYLFTVSAILFAILADITNFYERAYAKALGWVGFGIAIVGMVVGYWMPWWTLGVGEALAALPVAIHVIVTNNKI